MQRGLTEKEKKDLKASDVSVVVRHKKKRDQNNAAKVAKVAVVTKTSQTSHTFVINMSRSPATQFQQYVEAIFSYF